MSNQKQDEKMNVESIPHFNKRDAPYPICIRESKHGGVYSGAQWIIVAGLHKPVNECEAWGSKTQCHSFWTKREVRPTFAVKDNYRGFEVEAYAASGDNPNELIREMFEYYDE